MKTMNDYCREKFGKKLYKLSLDGGFTCPNRDGTKGTGGCIFCSASGSGDFAESGDNISTQIENAKKRVARKNKGGGYIAYFQSFTSTYAPIHKLRSLFYEAVEHPDIDVLSVATRPDCLPDETVELLGQLNKVKPVWVELGLQTSKPESVLYIGRGYENGEYASAVKRLHAEGIYVITHIILGLPGEDLADMRASLEFALENKTDGVKLQLLHILKDSPLYKEYEAGRVQPLTKDGYIEILRCLIPLIPDSTAVHRLTGDGNKKTLAAPLWSADKKDVLNSINKMIKELEEEKRYVFRPIRENELPVMLGIIADRVKWMDEVGIKQWNVTNYAEVYPLEYFRDHYMKGEVFVLEEKDSGDIAACAVLKHEDDRWEHIPDYKTVSALYLHNFAVRLDKKGTGSIFLRLAERYAAERGVECFRLDSADDNEKLRDYYTSRGFVPRGECVDGLYKGILREKSLEGCFH